MNPSPTLAACGPVRLDALTGVRALAAWAVVILHWSSDLRTLFPGWHRIHHVTDQGELGVDLFFMLSGFILVHNYQAAFLHFSWLEFRRFLWLRFARVYPAYLVSLMAMMALVLGAILFKVKYRAAAYDPGVLPWEILMLHAWRPGPFQLGWNYPDWSVSSEWFAYTILFVPVVRVVHLLKSTSLAAGLAIIALWIYNYALANGGRPNRQDHELSYIGLYFVAGALLWRPWQVWRERWSRVPGARLWVWLPLLATIALVVAPGGYIGWRCTFLAVAMWLYLFTLALPGSGPVRVHAHRWLVYWGEVSYALYLSHGVVIRVVKGVMGSEQYANSAVLWRIGWVGIALGLTVLAAMALHHGVEEPARKWLRRLGPKSHSP